LPKTDNTELCNKTLMKHAGNILHTIAVIVQIYMNYYTFLKNSGTDVDLMEEKTYLFL
jgi:hypothetical protein